VPTIALPVDRVLASDLTDGDTLASGIRILAARDDGPAGIYVVPSSGRPYYLPADARVDVLAYG
jgi:hypothetical protein